MKRVGVLLMVSWLMLQGVAHAATYYVSKSGNDNNSCGAAQSAGSPKSTINAGLGCLAPGDTLSIRAGTYDEVFNNPSIPSGGSWSNVTRIAAYPGETVWLYPQTGQWGIWIDANRSYIEFDGININGTKLSSTPIWFSTNNGNNPHHIRVKNAEIIAGAVGGAGAVNLGAHTRIGATGGFEVQNLTIHGGGTSGTCGWQCANGGVYVEGPNNLIENCNIYDTSGWAVQIYNSSGDSPDNNIVRNNVFHDITRYGDSGQLFSLLIAGNYNVAYNNVIYNMGSSGSRLGDGIDVYSGSNNAAYNNTIYNVANRGFDINTGVSGTIIRNNISYNSGVTNYNNNGSGTIAENNALNGVNPLFTDATRGNFHLQNGSALINAGVTVPLVTSDVEGTPRPQGGAYDIGAYEFRTSTLSAPTGVRVIP